MGLSPVTKSVAPYYDVNDVQIEWLSNMFMAVYPLLAMPSAYAMSKYGVRTTLTVAAGLHAAATAFQFAGSKQGSYKFVVIGQFCAAVACSNIIQIPGRLSAIWFPPHERGKSTSIGVFANILGVAIGFVQTSHMIPVTNDYIEVLAGLKLFFVSRLIAASIIFVSTILLYREHPPTPTSIIEGKKDLDFLESLKMLYNDLNFHLVAQAYGIYFGLLNTVAIIMPQLVSWKYSVEQEIQHLVSWMGFTLYSLYGLELQKL